MSSDKRPRPEVIVVDDDSDEERRAPPPPMRPVRDGAGGASGGGGASFELRELKGDLFSVPSTTSLAHCVAQARCRRLLGYRQRRASQWLAPSVLSPLLLLSSLLMQDMRLGKGIATVFRDRFGAWRGRCLPELSFSARVEDTRDTA